MNAFSTRALALLAILLLGSVAAYWVAEAFSVALDTSHDNEWSPARALLHGLDPYRLYLGCLACDNPPFPVPVAPSYPASGLMMLWPLAALPWPVARAVWAVSNLVFGAVLSLILWRLFLPRSGWRVLALVSIFFFAGTPFLNNLGNGQHAVFTLLFFAAGLCAQRRGSTRLASIFLAVSWFKYTLGVPLSLVFVVRGRWVVLLGAAAIHAVLTVFAAIWTGTNPVDLLLGPLRVANVATTPGHLNLLGLAARMGLESKLLPLVATAALTTAVVLSAWRSRVDDDLPLLSLLSLFAYAVVYHLGYDLVILVIPLCFVVSRVRSWHERDRLTRGWTIMLGVLLAWTWFADRPIQLMKIQHVDWVMREYPAYDAALAFWFYATIAFGVVLVGWRPAEMPSPRGVLKNEP